MLHFAAYLSGNLKNYVEILRFQKKVGMAEKDKKEAKVTANLTPDAVKVVAESMGIAGLPDDAALRLATDATYRLKHIIQVRQLAAAIFCG